MTATRAEKIAAGIHLATLGYHVLPIIPGQKRPPFPTGPGHANAATRDPEVIAAWYEYRPRWELAVVLHLSGHVAIDVDLKRATRQRTVDWFARLEHEAVGDTWPAVRWSDQTACQVTPGGGWHFIFNAPPSETRARMAPLIELQRHILVVAPSAGRRWIRPPHKGTREFPPALMPRAVPHRRARRTPRYAAHEPRTISRSAMAGLLATVERAEAGNRNSTLYWAACRLAEKGHLEHDPADLIFAAACTGLGLDEAIRTVEGALARHTPGPRFPRVSRDQRKKGESIVAT